MITTAITGIIAAILTFFGIPPGPYLAVVWIAVKVVIVGLMVGIAMWRRRKKKDGEQASTPG